MKRKRKKVAALPALCESILDTEIARPIMEIPIPTPKTMNSGLRPKRSTVKKARKAARTFHVKTPAASRDDLWLGSLRETWKMVVA